VAGILAQGGGAMKQWQEDILVFIVGMAFWTVLWLAYLAGQGELL